MNHSLKSYVGRLKWFEAFVIGYPVIAGLVPKKSPYLAPPLGNLSDLVSPLAFLVVGIVAILPWFVRKRTVAIRIATASSLLAICVLIAYSDTVAAQVIKLEGFNPHAVAYVSIGYERTQFAKDNYGSEPDMPMLKAFGHREEDIERLYTPDSIRFERLKLLYLYVGFFVFLNLSIGCFVRSDMLQRKR
jgi:hypothetical protein